MIRPVVGEAVEEGHDGGEEDDTQVVLELHRGVEAVAVTVPVEEVRHKTKLDRRC